MIGRALSEGYRSILPHGVYPAALLFIETPLEEVDVNVHPAKTEVRFRRSAAVADAVRDAVRSALAAAGYVREEREPVRTTLESETQSVSAAAANSNAVSMPDPIPVTVPVFEPPAVPQQEQQQSRMEFVALMESVEEALDQKELTSEEAELDEPVETDATDEPVAVTSAVKLPKPSALPPLNSAEKFAREVTSDGLPANIRPLGQLEESFIVATDDEGLLLIDQHVAHERVLFDKYRALEAERRTESQQLLVPETFDLTPAQAAVFDQLAPELETYGFELMRLSGRTVAIKATPADLPASEARNMLFELLDTVDAEKKGSARETLRDEIAASLACHAAIKVNMPLAPEKMRWLIDRLLQTSSPTTCPHGRPVILMLKTKDILKGFHRI
jgi:DNA mismatch repair protein MutL